MMLSIVLPAFFIFGIAAASQGQNFGQGTIDFEFCHDREACVN